MIQEKYCSLWLRYCNSSVLPIKEVNLYTLLIIAIINSVTAKSHLPKRSAVLSHYDAIEVVKLNDCGVG
jgi:hypothetical protein